MAQTRNEQRNRSAQSNTQQTPHPRSDVEQPPQSERELPEGGARSGAKCRYADKRSAFPDSEIRSRR